MSENISELSKNFNKKYGILPVRFDSISGDEMALSEHIEEFSQRLIFCLFCFFNSTLLCFVDVKQIVKALQAPAIGIKFLQFAPGEYFFASLKIAAFCGLILISPLIIYQVLLYVLPGMTKKERGVLLPMTLGSGILFGIGLLFHIFFLSLLHLIFSYFMVQKLLNHSGLLTNILTLYQY